MREARITRCKPTQSGTHRQLWLSKQNEASRVFHLGMSKQFGTFNLKNFTLLRKCYSYKLLNCGAFGDILIAKDAIKFSGGRLNGTKCTFRTQKRGDAVTDE